LRVKQWGKTPLQFLLLKEKYLQSYKATKKAYKLYKVYRKREKKKRNLN
jgi:hypothetical protein